MSWYRLLVHGRWFSPDTPSSSTTKTGRHDIAEILLKVALNTINQIKSNQPTKDRSSNYKYDYLTFAKNRLKARVRVIKRGVSPLLSA